MGRYEYRPVEPRQDEAKWHEEQDDERCPRDYGQQEETCSHGYEPSLNLDAMALRKLKQFVLLTVGNKDCEFEMSGTSVTTGTAPPSQEVNELGTSGLDS